MIISLRDRYKDYGNYLLFYNWKQETFPTLNMKFASPDDAVISLGDML